MSDQKEPNEPLDLLQLMADNDSKGIACPKCGCCDWRVMKTRRVQGAIQRYRVCRHCGHHRRTIETAG